MGFIYIYSSYHIWSSPLELFAKIKEKHIIIIYEMRLDSKMTPEYCIPSQISVTQPYTVSIQKQHVYYDSVTVPIH